MEKNVIIVRQHIRRTTILRLITTGFSYVLMILVCENVMKTLDFLMISLESV